MTTALECRDFVTRAAGTRAWGETREAWLAKAAHRLGINYRRARALFYLEARRIEHDEWKLLRHRCDQLAGRVKETQEAIDEAHRALAAADREDSEQLRGVGDPGGPLFGRSGDIRKS